MDMRAVTPAPRAVLARGRSADSIPAPAGVCRALLLLVICAWLPVAQGTHVYRWYDEDGHLHASDLPGDAGDAKLLAPVPPSVEERLAAERAREQEALRKQILQDHIRRVLEAQEAEAAAEAARLVRVRYCADARVHLRRYTRPNTHFASPLPDGSWEPMSRAELESLISYWRSEVQRLCEAPEGEASQ